MHYSHDKNYNEEALIDYLSSSVYSESSDLYKKCNSCGRYTWYRLLAPDLCPLCLVNQPVFVMEISFAPTKSKKFRAATNKARSIPGYIEFDDRHIVQLLSIEDYIFANQYHTLEELLTIVSGWKSFQVFICGVPYKNSYLERLCNEFDYLYRLRLIKSL